MPGRASQAEGTTSTKSGGTNELVVTEEKGGQCSRIMTSRRESIKRDCSDGQGARSQGTRNTLNLI